MEKYTGELYRDMMQQVQQLALTSDHELPKAEQCFHIVETAMIKLRDFIYQHTFTDEDKEIRFFKEIKPRFHAELVYYAELIHIEANKPFGSKELVTSFYRQVIQRLQVYFERRHTYYIYYRSQRKAEDRLLFLRKSDCVPVVPEDNLDMDRTFSTIGSSWFSKFIGFERIIEHLLQRIDRIENGGNQLEQPHKHLTVWTDSKAALVELAYALHARGSLNHGHADVKDIITELEYLFNVQLGNFYRTYFDMGIRKKSRTPYIDSLKETLERRMDEGLG